MTARASSAHVRVCAGRVIHEFDPWFNYRATEYMVEHGWAEFQVRQPLHTQRPVTLDVVTPVRSPLPGLVRPPGVVPARAARGLDHIPGAAADGLGALRGLQAARQGRLAQ